MGTVLASGDLPTLTRVLAAGYHGPPELTLTRAFTEWTFDPWMTALVVILGGSYLAALCRVAGWPVARRIWFLGLGLGFLVIATMSWVGAYQPVLMYARAVQTVLLVLVVPLFLALGRPISLFTAVFPATGRRLESAIGSRPARLVTFPAITTFTLVAVPFVMYFTSWYTAVFRSGTVRELTYLALMVPGFVFFWTLLRVDPVPKKYSYAVSMWITGAEVIGDAFLGIAVIANQNLIGAAYYHALARPWGPTLATDEVIAGGVLWVLGDLVGLPFLAAQLIQMMREDESDAARIDADLDAKDAELEAAAAAQEPDAEPRPWWEDDPRFTGRFKANLGQRPRPGVSACGRESQPAAGSHSLRRMYSAQPCASSWLDTNSCAFIAHQEGMSV
jgi:cytochrome c oxidase assembly factor CtaG